MARTEIARLLVAIGLVLCIQHSDALTIYRIGGAERPAPEIAAPYEFIQLDWADADPNVHGVLDQLTVDGGSIQPKRLDPDINLTPLIEVSWAVRSSS